MDVLADVKKDEIMAAWRRIHYLPDRHWLSVVLIDDKILLFEYGPEPGPACVHGRYAVTENQNGDYRFASY